MAKQKRNFDKAVELIRLAGKNRRPFVIGFTAGAFDLCHAGHALMFAEVRSQCDYLVVGLHSDPTLDRPEKNKPVMSLSERAIILQSNRNVDEVVIYDTEEELVELLTLLNPAVRFVGADWKGKKFTGNELPIKVVFNSRDHQFSTSELRKRIYEAEDLRLRAEDVEEMAKAAGQ